MINTDKISSKNNKPKVSYEFKRSYDVILFDLDGTLTDPKVGITKSIQYSLASFGIKVDDLDTLEKFIGPPLKEAFMEYYGFEEAKAIAAIEKYREYFSVTGLYENEIYPGIPELLQKLTSKCKKLIVATSKPTVFAKLILKHFHINQFFSVVAGSNLDGTRTKKGEVIDFAIQEFGLKDISTAVMIGDRKHDIIGAKETGMDSIGVAYGYGSYEELLKERPAYIAHTVKELEEFLT